MLRLRSALGNDPPLAGIYRTAVEDTTIGGKNVIKGQRVFASIAKANVCTPLEQMKSY